MLDFRRMNDRARFPVFSICASTCRTAEISLNFFVNRPVEISRTNIGIQHGLIVIEFFRAGRGLGQARPDRPDRALGNGWRYGRGRRRLIAAAKSKCGNKNPDQPGRDAAK